MACAMTEKDRSGQKRPKPGLTEKDLPPYKGRSVFGPVFGHCGEDWNQ